MTLMELLKQLVNTEDPKERFKLVEDNNDMIKSLEGGEDTSKMKAEFDKLSKDFESLTKDHSELNQKYQDRFFSTSDKKEEEKKEETEQTKTLEEVAKEMA